MSSAQLASARGKARQILSKRKRKEKLRKAGVGNDQVIVISSSGETFNDRKNQNTLAFER